MKYAIIAASLASVTIAGLALAQDPRTSWGASRGPVAKCPSIKKATPPSVAEITQLLRCAKESANASSGELWLLKTVNVEIGGATAFRALYNIVTMPEADTTKQVYPIRGDFTWSVCTWLPDTKNPGKNCAESTVSKATGACWRTTFGDWKCTMNGTTGPTTRGLPAV